jgi:hypothetical protein
MITYIGNKDIDRKRWDACIAKAHNSLVYAYSWYLDILCPEQWDALIGDDYESVFPLPFRKKYGIRYIYTPFFIQQLGVYSQRPLIETEINSFLDSIPEDFRLVELNLNVYNVASANGFNYVTNLNHELNLGMSYELVRRNYSENLIRNLKKAANNNLAVIKDESADQVIDLFRAEKGREVKHWGNKEYDIFRHLLAECSMRGVLEIKGAYSDKGDFVAGIIFLRSDSRAIFLFSATGPIARELNAMPWMVDDFIREHAGKNLILDFEGSNDEGLARFYKSFGANQTIYQRAERNSLPGWINFLRKSIK